MQKKKVVAKYETKDFSFFIPIGRKGRNPKKQKLFSFWHGPPAQIDFDTFLKVKKLPKLAREGGGCNLNNAQKEKAFFSGIPSLRWWKQFGDLGKFSHIKLACLESIGRFATSSSPTLGC